MDFPTDEPLPKTMSKIHGTMVFFGSVPNRIQPHLHICFSGKRWPASVLQSFPASFVLFWMQCLLKQSDYWQCESFSVNVFVCLRGLPTLLLQPTLVRAYLADRQAPPTRHYPPVRSRGAQPVSHTTHLCLFMPWGFKAIKTMCFKFGKILDEVLICVHLERSPGSAGGWRAVGDVVLRG